MGEVGGGLTSAGKPASGGLWAPHCKETTTLLGVTLQVSLLVPSQGPTSASVGTCMLDQELDGRHVTVPRGVEEGVAALAGAGVQVSPALQQESHDLVVALEGGALRGVGLRCGGGGYGGSVMTPRMGAERCRGMTCEW